MPKDSQRATNITKALTEFTALDDQPLFVVDSLLNLLEPKYEIPSRRYITESALPKMHDFVKKHVKGMLQNITAFSFTTDTWASCVCLMPIISLTAQ